MRIGEGHWKISTRVGVRKLKRHERRAPDTEFVGTVSQGSSESFRSNHWADGFESRWDSPKERRRKEQIITEVRETLRRHRLLELL